VQDLLGHGQADSGMYFVSASQAVLLDALTSPKPPCTRETAKTQLHYPAADSVLYTAQSLSCRRSLFGPRFANAKQQKFALDALSDVATGLPSQAPDNYSAPCFVGSIQKEQAAVSPVTFGVRR
jgi:hypothetical protein